MYTLELCEVKGIKEIQCSDVTLKPLQRTGCAAGRIKIKNTVQPRQARAKPWVCSHTELSRVSSGDTAVISQQTSQRKPAPLFLPTVPPCSPSLANAPSKMQNHGMEPKVEHGSWWVGKSQGKRLALAGVLQSQSTVLTKPCNEHSRLFMHRWESRKWGGIVTNTGGK